MHVRYPTVREASPSLARCERREDESQDRRVALAVQEGIELALGAPPTPRMPASAIDEGVLAIGSPVAPWTIQMEASVVGRLDENRLRDAVAAALQWHPLARVRTKAQLPHGRSFAWEVPEVTDTDPLDRVTCASDPDMGRARAELLSSDIPLWRSRPLRARLARGASLHHAAVGGIGALRILQSTARAYAGVADPLPEVDPRSVRDPAAWGQDSGIQATIRRAGGAIGELRHALSRSTRLGTGGATPSPGLASFTLRSLPIRQVG